MPKRSARAAAAKVAALATPDAIELPASTDGYIVSSPAYGDLKPGDKCVVISGPWKDWLRGARLEFIEYQLCLLSGKSWLLMWGGRPGHESWFAIYPECLGKRVDK